MWWESEGAGASDWVVAEIINWSAVGEVRLNRPAGDGRGMEWPYNGCGV